MQHRTYNQALNPQGNWVTIINRLFSNWKQNEKTKEMLFFKFNNDLMTSSDITQPYTNYVLYTTPATLKTMHPRRGKHLSRRFALVHSHKK